MKNLSLTLCLVLAASVAFAQQALDKPVALVHKISLPQKQQINKNNPAYYRAERMPMHKIDKSAIESRNADVSSAGAVINEVKAFPNPFSTQVDVFITDGHMDKSAYKAELFDVEGRKVHSESLFLNQTPLQLSHLGKGVYLLYIEKNGKVIKQEKLVKE